MLGKKEELLWGKRKEKATLAAFLHKILEHNDQVMHSAVRRWLKKKKRNRNKERSEMTSRISRLKFKTLEMLRNLC